MGSFVPTFDLNGVKHQAFAVYTGTQGVGAVEIYFQWYAGKPPFSEESKRRDMLAKLNRIPGVELPEDSITRRPNISLQTLASEESLHQFLKVMEWYLAEVRAANRATSTGG